jgi:hypothetical protein
LFHDVFNRFDVNSHSNCHAKGGISAPLPDVPGRRSLGLPCIRLLDHLLDNQTDPTSWGFCSTPVESFINWDLYRDYPHIPDGLETMTLAFLYRLFPAVSPLDHINVILPSDANPAMLTRIGSLFKLLGFRSAFCVPASHSLIRYFAAQEPNSLTPDCSVLIVALAPSRVELISLKITSPIQILRIARHVVSPSDIDRDLVASADFLRSRAEILANFTAPDFVCLTGPVSGELQLFLCRELQTASFLVSKDPRAVVLGGLRIPSRPSDFNAVLIEPRSLVTVNFGTADDRTTVYERGGLVERQIVTVDFSQSVTIEFDGHVYAFEFIQMCKAMFHGFGGRAPVSLELHFDYDSSRCLPDIVRAFAQFAVTGQNVTDVNRTEQLSILKDFFDVIFEPPTNATVAFAAEMKAAIVGPRQEEKAHKTIVSAVTKAKNQLKFEPTFRCVATEEEQLGILGNCLRSI